MHVLKVENFENTIIQVGTVEHEEVEIHATRMETPGTLKTSKQPLKGSRRTDTILGMNVYAQLLLLKHFKITQPSD